MLLQDLEIRLLLQKSIQTLVQHDLTLRVKVGGRSLENGKPVWPFNLRGPGSGSSVLPCES